MKAKAQKAADKWVTDDIPFVEDKDHPDLDSEEIQEWNHSIRAHHLKMIPAFNAGAEWQASEMAERLLEKDKKIDFLNTEIGNLILENRELRMQVDDLSD